MRSNLAGTIGLDNSVAGDQGRIDDWANRGVRDILLRTECYVTSTTLTEAAGTGDYTLDTAIMSVVGWQWTSNTLGSGVPERTSPQEILRMRANVASAISTPAAFFALGGANLLMVYPTPGSADTVTIYYVPRPTEMSSGTHDPATSTYGGIPVEYHDGLELYMCWKAAEYSNLLPDAQSYRFQYEGQNGRGGFIGRMNREIKLKGGPLPKAVVNRNRRARRFLLHDPSVY